MWFMEHDIFAHTQLLIELLRMILTIHRRRLAVTDDATHKVSHFSI